MDFVSSALEWHENALENFFFLRSPDYHNSYINCAFCLAFFYYPSSSAWRVFILMTGRVAAEATARNFRGGSAADEKAIFRIVLSRV